MTDYDRLRRTLGAENGTTQPPHSRDAERSVLGCLLLDHRIAGPGVRYLQVDDFYATPHQEIFAAIRGMEIDGASIDGVTIKHRLEAAGRLDSIGGEAYLIELARFVDLPQEPDPYVRIVKEFSFARRVLAAAKSIVHLASDPRNFATLAETWRAETRAVDERLEELRPATDTDGVVELCALLDTEFEEREELIDGWLQVNRTMILFGDTHAGKSVLAWNIALALARGYGDVLGHAVADQCYRVGLFLGENDLRELRDAYRTILADSTPIGDQLFLCDVMAGAEKPDLGTAAGQAWYRRTIERHKLEVVIFDTTTMLVHGDLSDRQTAKDTMAFFTSLRKDLGCSVIAVAHPRKGAAQKDESSPTDRLYGAAEWGNLACALTSLHWQDPVKRDAVVVQVLKSRGIPPSRRPGRIIARLNEETLSLDRVAELERPPTPARATSERLAEDIFFAIRSAGDWMTVARLTELLGKTKRTINRAIAGRPFSVWVRDDFVQIERGAGSAPTRYKASGTPPGLDAFEGAEEF